VDLSHWAGHYSIFAAGIPTGGLTAAVAASGGTGHFSDNADIVTGNAGSDWLYASGGADIVVGGAGNDYIDGGSGLDVINGDAGDDTLMGGAGADVIDGGAGTDTASYAGASAGVGVDLGQGIGTAGEAAGDSLASIEIVVGSNQADTLVGAASADTLIGAGGADTIQGAAGADVLTGGAGADTFVFSDVDSDVDTTATAATDTITDFETADLLDFDAAGAEANYVEAGEAAANLGALLSAADAALNGTVTYYFGTVGTDGYLVFDADGTGITSVVKLAGVDATEISAANIV
jgi:Ca2+-binding RTX toxin-like protein